MIRDNRTDDVFGLQAAGLQGSELDEPLHYNQIRWFDPSVGRFLDVDPVGFADGPNEFVYASNAPSNDTDPTVE